jgi:hypothetical protein
MANIESATVVDERAVATSRENGAVTSQPSRPQDTSNRDVKVYFGRTAVCAAAGGVLGSLNSVGLTVVGAVIGCVIGSGCLCEPCQRLQRRDADQLW